MRQAVASLCCLGQASSSSCVLSNLAMEGTLFLCQQAGTTSRHNKPAAVHFAPTAHVPIALCAVATTTTVPSRSLAAGLCRQAGATPLSWMWMQTKSLPACLVVWSSSLAAAALTRRNAIELTSRWLLYDVCAETMGLSRSTHDAYSTHYILSNRQPACCTCAHQAASLYHTPSSPSAFPEWMCTQYLVPSRIPYRTTPECPIVTPSCLPMPASDMCVTYVTFSDIQRAAYCFHGMQGLPFVLLLGVYSEG